MLTLPNSTFASATKHSAQFLAVLKELAMISLCYLPIRTLQITALALSLLGNIGREFSKKASHTAKKLTAICKHYKLDTLNLKFHSTFLCSAKNIASKSSIWNEKDLSKSQEFINTAKNQKYWRDKGFQEFSSSDLDKLQNYSVKGAMTDGICFGASLVTIKSLHSIDIKTEKELVQAIEKFKNGFSKEAAALQNLNIALRGHRQSPSPEDKKLIATLANNKAQDLFNRITRKKNDPILNAEDTEKIQRKLTAKVRQMRLYRNRTNKLQRVASLIDLKLKQRIPKYERSFFTGIINSTKIQEKFNYLKEGYYQLLFRANDTEGHSIVYIKKEFGSYLLDPNGGLIKCSSNNPAKELSELLKKHYPGKRIENKQREQFLEIYRY